MSEQESGALEIFAGLKDALGVECSECGEVNPSDAEKCENCGAYLPMEEEEEAQLSFVHGQGLSAAESEAEEVEGVEKVEKVPLEQSANLVMLRETVQGVEEGTITVEQYVENVTKVKNLAETTLTLSNTDIVQNKIAELPPEQKTVAEKTIEYTRNLYQGAQKMLEFDGSDLHPAVDGLAIIERAMYDLDHVQDKAIEMAYQEDLKKKEDKQGGGQEAGS